jgi:hypothetical protein
MRTVALGAADERERRAGAAAGVLDDRRPGLDQAVALGALDHREPHSVLHRTGRVAVLELDPDLGAATWDDPMQAHERRVADRAEDAVVRHAFDYRTGSWPGESAGAAATAATVSVASAVQAVSPHSQMNSRSTSSASPFAHGRA